MHHPLLYYITDRAQFAGDESSRRRQLLDKIAEAAACGIDFIQLREKDLTARELEAMAREALDILRQPPAQPSEIGPTKLLINSRTDVALAVHADGVHLRSDDLSPAEVRSLANTVLSRNLKPESRNLVVSVSCHSEAEVRSAADAGADFVVFAPVFEKLGSPAARPTGLEALSRVCRYGVPVFALGGVTIENAHSCVEAGATGIAGIRLFQQNAIAQVMRALRR